MRECSREVLLDLETDEMPDGPRIVAADGGRHGLPGGTARAHEPPAASARLTGWCRRLAGPAITQLCATAHRDERPVCGMPTRYPRRSTSRVKATVLASWRRCSRAWRAGGRPPAQQETLPAPTMLDVGPAPPFVAKTRTWR